MAKRYYKKRAYRKKVPVKKTKKLVTGQGPTLLERIASQSDNIGRVAKAILPMAMAINTEAKYFDQQANSSAYNPGTNDAIINLTQGIAQGTTDITRIGNSVLAKNLALRLMLAFAPTATTGPLYGFARVILMVWKENLQINAPTAAKVFEQPGFFHSPFNKDYTDQMVIIKDKIISMVPPINASTYQSGHFLKVFKPLDFHLRWIAGSTTDGSVNHVYLIIRGSETLSSNAVAYNYYSRLNFTDN